MITRGAPHNRGALFSFLHKRPGDILIQNRDLRHTVRELDGIGQIAAVKLPLPDRPRALVVVAQPKEVFARAHCFEPAELGKVISDHFTEIDSFSASSSFVIYAPGPTVRCASVTIWLSVYWMLDMSGGAGNGTPSTA